MVRLPRRPELSEGGSEVRLRLAERDVCLAELPAAEGVEDAVVTSRCLRDGRETIEVRYDISSLALGVERLARAVRGYWGVENGCHWVLDVTYREDDSRIRQAAL